MEDVFTWTAIVGGSALAIQTLLTVLGIGLDEFDIDAGMDLEHADAAHEHMLGALSLRGLVAFATFFGLAGLGAQAGGLGNTLALAVALAAGLAAIFLVAQLMTALAKLQSSGNVDIRRAIGEHAHVYLRIPANGDGQGRVHVNVQGRRIEVRAIARGGEIPTGTDVVVRDVSPDGALIVEPAAAPVAV